MDTAKTSEPIDLDRRRLFGAAAFTLAAAQFGMLGSAHAQPGKSKLAGMATVPAKGRKVFKSLGMAIEDLTAARLVWETLREVSR